MQQSYVFLNAVNIFKDDVEMQTEIIPIICQKIRNYSEDLQAQAGLSFFDLIDHKVGRHSPLHNLTRSCLRLSRYWTTSSPNRSWRLLRRCSPSGASRFSRLGLESTPSCCRGWQRKVPRRLRPAFSEAWR